MISFFIACVLQSDPDYSGFSELIWQTLPFHCYFWEIDPNILGIPSHFEVCGPNKSNIQNIPHQKQWTLLYPAREIDQG